EVEVAGGSFGTRMARAFYGRGNETWGIGVSLDYLGGQGDFGFLNDQGTRFDTSDDVEVDRRNNAFDRLSGMAKGHVNLADGVTLRLLNLLTWRKMGLAGTGIDPTQEARLQTLRNLLGARLELTRMTSLNISASLSPWLSWSETRFEDPLGEVGNGTDDTRDSSLAPGVSAMVRVPIVLDEDVQYTLSLTASSEYRHEAFQPGQANGATAGRASTRDFATAAGEIAFIADPVDLELVGAVRWESVHSTLNQPQTIFDLVADPVDQDGEGALTWRAALLQRSIPHTELRINVADAMRFPSLFELFGNTGAVIGNPSLRPEAGLTIDTGFLHRAGWLAPGNVWAVEVHAFYTQLDDLIQLVPNAQNVLRAENTDSGIIAGVEAGSWADLAAHVRVRASLTWMETEDTSPIKARKGKRLPQRPQWQAFGRVAGYHDFDRVSVGEVGLAVEVEHLAGNFLDFANLVEVPPRTTLGVSAWAAFWSDQLRVDVSLRNLTASRVQDFAGFPLPGLSILASLRYTPARAAAAQGENTSP
ncbi:MAG: hypothetical protein ACI9WU_003432, partial [Myxococcota bacterium]